MSAPVLFTAAEIARCLVCTPQAVRNALRGIATAARKVVSGVETSAWHFDSLPSPLIVRLAKCGRTHGYTTPLQYLQNGPRPEKPLPSAAQVASKEIDSAQKLQRTLAECLVLPAEVSTAERARLAAPEYRREFGHVVSDRHLRRVIDRVISAGRRPPAI